MKDYTHTIQSATMSILAISTTVAIGKWLIKRETNHLSDTVNRLEKIIQTMGGERRQADVDAKQSIGKPQPPAQMEAPLNLSKQQIIEQNDPEPLKKFLEERGIQIKHLPPQTECNEVLDQLGHFMGNHYNEIVNVYKRIKCQMNHKGALRMNLRNEPKNNLSIICQFCSRLHKIAFLESYHYKKSPRYEIQLQTSHTPKAINFLSGQWLEHYIRHVLVQLVADLGRETGQQIPISYVINPQIILPNGDDFELDLLCKVGNDIFWIESKTGNYQQYVDKYARMAKLLGLDEEHSLMVLTDVSEKTALDLTQLFGMNVIPLENVGTIFRGYLQRYYATTPVSPRVDKSCSEPVVVRAPGSPLPAPRSSQTQPVYS